VKRLKRWLQGLARGYSRQKWTRENPITKSAIRDNAPESRGSSVDAPASPAISTEEIEAFIPQIVDGSLERLANGGNPEGLLVEQIAQVDRILSGQLSEIMHHPDFQRLEASWRGLSYLTERSQPDDLIQIKILNVTKGELRKDLQRAQEFDQSTLFQKVYGDVYSTFGCAPFGALIGDYEFGKSLADLEMIEKISSVAAAAHSPFVTAASSGLFDLPSFATLGTPRHLSKIFANNGDKVCGTWKAFRQSEDSRFVAMCLPRTLGRLPYGKDTQPVEGFNYEEHVDGSGHSKYLWVNAAYALASRMTNSFAEYGMCVAMSGVEGGLVEGLPVHGLYPDQDGVADKCPTEVRISASRDMELSGLGFIPLVHCTGTDFAAFFSVQSAHKPKLYDTDLANINARRAIEIPRIMAVARFVHHMKATMRDKTGPPMARHEVEVFLNRWIMAYVNPDTSARAAKPAQYPLSQARIQICEMPGKEGCYRAVAILYPSFLLDEMPFGLRVVTDLPAAVRPLQNLANNNDD
jgi:type VI secretion system protein ImpC